MGIELAAGFLHTVDANGRSELVGLLAVGTGFRTFPQEFESFRTNPQEPSPARTARCQVVDFQQTARSVRACGLRTFSWPEIWLTHTTVVASTLQIVGTCRYLPMIRSDPDAAPALQGGLADVPAGGQLFLIEASDFHLGLLPKELAGVHEGAVRPTSQAVLLWI